MQVNGPGNIQGPDPIRPGGGASRYVKPVSESSGSDSAKISDLARLKALLKDVPDIRLEKIEKIRSAIEAGTYETPDKIDTVIDRLLEEL